MNRHAPAQYSGPRFSVTTSKRTVIGFLLICCVLLTGSSLNPERRTVRVSVQTFGFASKATADALMASLRARGKAYYSVPATVHADDGRAMTSYLVIVPVDVGGCSSQIEFGEWK